MVKHVQFPNLPGTTILLFYLFEFRIRNNYFVGHKKVEISNVCVLPGKYNAYGEKLMVYGYLLVKRQHLERTNNVSSKKEIQMWLCLCSSVSSIIMEPCVGLWWYTMEAFPGPTHSCFVKRKLTLVNNGL